MEKNEKRNLRLSTYEEYESSIKRNNKYIIENNKKIKIVSKGEIQKLREQIKQIQEQSKIKPILKTATSEGYVMRIRQDRNLCKETHNFIENEDSKKIK